MAARFVVALAVLATCHSTPVVRSGVISRDGRSYSIGQAYGDGVSLASANVNGGAAQAFGRSTGSQAPELYPGQAIAQAGTYDAPHPGYETAKAVAQAQNSGYYQVPEPATVITYEQNYEVPAQVVYEYQSPLKAQSSALSNGVVDSSISSATSNGDGLAKSSAQTQRGAGSFGVTSTNAKTYGPGSYNTANSNAKSGFGSAATSAQTKGYGAASSTAQTNGVAGIVNPVDSAVVLARNGYEAPHVPAIPTYTSSNANVNGYGNAASSAKASQGASGISWRFGTAYDSPAAARAQANANGYGSAGANANVNGAGYVKTIADTQDAGFGTAKSTANANGAGSALSNAAVNGAGYGTANSNANTQYGNAAAAAKTQSGYEQAQWSRNALNYGGLRTDADAQSSGLGSANSLAKSQGLSTTYKVSETSANSSGYGSAHAKAHA